MNYRGYRDIEIDEQALSQLPEDSGVRDQVTHDEYGPQPPPPPPPNQQQEQEQGPGVDEGDSRYNNAAVPNLQPDNRAVQELHDRIRAQRERQQNSSRDAEGQQNDSRAAEGQQNDSRAAEGQQNDSHNDVASLPDVEVDVGEAGAEPRQLSARPHLTWPAVEEVPPSEYDRSQPLLSLAFPTLFPTGEADIA